MFTVVSRYHGGAFVVFSNQLNEGMEVAALDGTYASVIGGAPAAAVVFAREVDRRAREEATVKAISEKLAATEPGSEAALWAQYKEAYARARSEKLGNVADEFDATHSVQRALDVGSIHKIVPPPNLRPYLIEAVERGHARELSQGVGQAED